MFFLSLVFFCSAIRVRRGRRLECKLRSSGQERQTWRVVVKNRGLCPLPYRLILIPLLIHHPSPPPSFLFHSFTFTGTARLSEPDGWAGRCLSAGCLS